MQRAPAPSKNFVRGKSGHVPFWPGGLEEALGDIDDDAVTNGKSYGLRTIPPGFTRGLRLPGEENDIDDLERMEEDGDDGVTQLRPVSIPFLYSNFLAYLHYRGLLERSPHWHRYPVLILKLMNCYQHRCISIRQHNVTHTLKTLHSGPTFSHQSPLDRREPKSRSKSGIGHT